MLPGAGCPGGRPKEHWSQTGLSELTQGHLLRREAAAQLESSFVDFSFSSHKVSLLLTSPEVPTSQGLSIQHLMIDLAHPRGDRGERESKELVCWRRETDASLAQGDRRIAEQLRNQ